MDKQIAQSIADNYLKCLNKEQKKSEYFFVDSNGDRYLVTNAELICKHKTTGEILFHFPLEVSSLKRE